jgi:NitT/TauT family transport system permease protein
VKGYKGSKALNFIAEYAVSIAVFILIWKVYIVIKKVPEFMVPDPKSVLHQLIKLVAEGTIWGHFFVTTGEVFSGFIVGSILGILCGYILVKIPLLKDALMPYILFAQTAPKIALVPLFVMWFGLGFISKLILIISMVFFPVMAGTILGIESISKDIRNLMKILNATKFQTFMEVEMPSSLPMIFSGLKVGMVQAVIGAIVAEWISGKMGLGYVLTYASSTYNTALLIAGIIVTVIVGIIFYELVNVLEDKLLYWHESKQNVGR